MNIAAKELQKRETKLRIRMNYKNVKSQKKGDYKNVKNSYSGNDIFYSSAKCPAMPEAASVFVKQG